MQADTENAFVCRQNPLVSLQLARPDWISWVYGVGRERELRKGRVRRGVRKG